MRGPRNTNRIRGGSGRTSDRLFAKSISVKGQACRSGGRARKDAELTPGRAVPCLWTKACHDARD